MEEEEAGVVVVVVVVVEEEGVCKGRVGCVQLQFLCITTSPKLHRSNVELGKPVLVRACARARCGLRIALRAYGHEGTP